LARQFLRELIGSAVEAYVDVAQYALVYSGFGPSRPICTP